MSYVRRSILLFLIAILAIFSLATVALAKRAQKLSDNEETLVDLLADALAEVVHHSTHRHTPAHHHTTSHHTPTHHSGHHSSGSHHSSSTHHAGSTHHSGVHHNTGSHHTYGNSGSHHTGNSHQSGWYNPGTHHSGVTHHGTNHYQPIQASPMFHGTPTRTPVTHKPATHKPVTHKPVPQQPVTHKPVTYKPITQKPATQKPSSGSVTTPNKPVTSKPAPAVTSAPASKTSAPVAPSSKAQIALKQILKSEGGCQNSANDKGNHFQGHVGYTCAGVIPSLGYENRNGAFAYANDYKGDPAGFVHYAYNKDPSKFKEAAAQVYTTQYFEPAHCTKLPMPAYMVCSDIAVNSGVGRAKNYMLALGTFKGGDAKEYARKMNDLHRQDYKKWGAEGTSNHKFLKGWLARADDRDKFINNYKE